MTWETVQKENYLAKLEHEHRESSAERLRCTSAKVQTLLRMVGGFKEQEKRMATVEAEVKYCGEVLSWIAECFHKSTLKCDRDAPKAPQTLVLQNDRLKAASVHSAERTLKAPSTAFTNNIYAAVIRVFSGEGLQPMELYSLNLNTRWLQRTDMGFFIKEFFQNHILTKGLSYILDEIKKYEALINLLCLLGQGHDLTVRQMSLLGFRDLVLLKLSLSELLRSTPSASLIPASITQMLLILQGIQESRGLSKEYCQLESLIALVISPYLRNCRHTNCIEHRNRRASLCPPEIKITHHISEGSLLSPVTEQEVDTPSERLGNLRRHSVTNAHSDIHLLAVTAREYSGIQGSCQTAEVTSSII
ncbi:hypothetical protein DNTS_014117 [Danionella cerebrum]|uniref:Uncharacterized protein n=1 Tax=Danionella cerebrum TaxID=2873325 RepID=A0A553RF76_9TELE|nr:hypothetical protein DNTS_014117 [Danionella translucida]